MQPETVAAVSLDARSTVTAGTLQCAEEQFEAGGEELRRHFSMDGSMEPEKLRAASSAEAQRQGLDPLFTGDSGLGDDMMSTGGLCSND